jgi:hypothetical protein
MLTQKHILAIAKMENQYGKHVDPITKQTYQKNHYYNKKPEQENEGNLEKKSKS